MLSARSIAPTATYSSSEYRPPGADRCDAHQFERSFMPAGMWPRQNDMTSPKTRVSIPAPLRWAEMERPEGPAPTTVIRQTDFGERALAPALRGWTVVIVAFMVWSPSALSTDIVPG